jgi:hypothetical protein
MRAGRDLATMGSVANSDLRYEFQDDPPGTANSPTAIAILIGEHPFLGGVHCTSVGLANGKGRGPQSR